MTVSQIRIFWFFVATFAFSWISILGNWLWPSAAWLAPVNPYGPAVAAVLVILVTEGRDGLRRFWGLFTNFRAPGWLYAVALFVPLAIVLFTLGRASLSGVTIGPLPAREWSEFLILVPVLLLAGPLQEHPSFQGYAQLQLERDLTPLTSALFIGLGVFIWHLPIFMISGFWPPIALGIVGMAVVNAWMLKTGGSVWPLVLAHLSINYFGGGYVNRTITEPIEQTLYQGIMGGCYVFWAVYLIWRYGPALADQSRVGGTERLEVKSGQL